MTSLRILAVCTGNICRSPAVERLLAARLGAAYRGRAAGGLAPAIEVGSAGTAAVVGAPMTASMAELVTRAGGDASRFVARQLTPSLVREADLVLTLTRRHRAAVVELVPAALRRTFTLRELARLALRVDPAKLPGTGATTADRVAALLPLAAASRNGGGAARASADDDVVDPYGGDDALYARSFEQLLPAVQTIVSVVRR
jgi:protein-tyrosine phosphatase